MTKVLALVTFKIFPPQMGGQKGVAHFYKHLKNLLPLTLAVSRNNVYASDWDVEPILFTNKKMFLNPFMLGRLKKMVKAKGIDIIIAEHSYAGWIAWLLRKMTGKPFILHSHNIEALRFKQMDRNWWRLYWHYEKWIHRQSDSNFFISAEDKAYAIQHFALPSTKCNVVTYGIEEIPISNSDKEAWLQSFDLKGNETIFYFNGTLDYKPNYEAVLILQNTIIPHLEKSLENFVIVVSGNHAPALLVEQLNKDSRFLYVGFAQDAAQLYAVADVFLNPVVNNSGVKTKVIEAIGYGCHVVSTESGASGINIDLCGDKLSLAPDNDWQEFAELALTAAQTPKIATPKPFYNTYLWNNIAAAAAAIISQVAHKHDPQ